MNTAKTELETKLAEFNGLDAKLAEANAKLAEANAKLVEAQAKLAAQPSDRVAELEAGLEAERAAHTATKFKQIVTYEFLRAGGRESAVNFMVGNAKAVFKMKDGRRCSIPVDVRSDDVW